MSNLIYECETLLPFDLKKLKRIKFNRRIDSAFGFNEKSDHTDVSKCQTSIKKLEAKGLLGIGGENNTELEEFTKIVVHGHLHSINNTIWSFTKVLSF